MSEVVDSLEIALVSHEHKGRSQGTIGKTFQGMNRWWRARKGNGSNDVREPILDDHIESLYHRFSLAGIRASTNDFNNDLLFSEDSSFRLYKGCMVGGTRAVIIKQYKSRAVNLAKRVSSEIGVQSLPRHPNIVSLIGFCEEKDELILVYDYMGNGTLKSHLHGSDNDPLLWKKRLEICIDIARGLEYLHTNVGQQFVHRDIKPSNVLLDNEWVAKIGDFEFALPIPTSMATEGVETYMCGTLGYFELGYLGLQYLRTGMFLEYIRTGKATTKATTKTDVYSFGVVLLEVLCAKRAYTSNRNEDKALLVDWFRECIERGSIDEVIDPYLIGKIAPACFMYYVNIALSCVVEKGIQRPSMNDVLRGLQISLQLQEAWENSVEMGDESHMADVPGCMILLILLCSK